MNLSIGNAELALSLNPVKPETVGMKKETRERIGAEELTRGENSGADMPQLSRDDLEHINLVLNKFLQMLNADLQFTLHEETQRLIVQVIDSKNQTVLKEFPPRELLDMMAKLHDYVGFLLDKKA